MTHYYIKFSNETNQYAQATEGFLSVKEAVDVAEEIQSTDSDPQSFKIIDLSGCIYYESNEPKEKQSCGGKVVEIDGKKYKLVEV